MFTINDIKNFIINKFFRSLPSKILIIFGIITTIISIFFKESFGIIFAQLITYLFFASLSNCMYYGNCKIRGWIFIIFPILGSIIIILNKLAYFDSIKPELNEINKHLKNFKNFIRFKN